MTNDATKRESGKPGGSVAERPRTYFAPPDRLAGPEVRSQAERIAGDPIVRAILDSMDGYLLVLNEQRQVLVENERVLGAVGAPDSSSVIGRRPGELLRCIHSTEGPAGCGTSRACADCGAVLAILDSHATGTSATGECRLTLAVDAQRRSLELRVRATPIRVRGEDLTVVAMTDVSAEKRRNMLERVFFHDIMNTIGGLKGWTRLLADADRPAPPRAADRIASLTERLIREIEDQRQLLRAEEGRLVVSRRIVSVRSLLEQLRSIFDEHRAARARVLKIEAADDGERIETDPTLLVRVLTNMLKNALEAVEDGEAVRVWYERTGAEPVFHVWNPGGIPPEVARQIFQRSFSTKEGSGRGIGTYSMKLFGERYLGGTVDFESTPEGGTNFTLRLPPSAVRRTGESTLPESSSSA